MTQTNKDKNRQKQMNSLARGMVAPTPDKETCWVFKRVLNSELDQHLVFKVVYVTSLEFTKRGGWRRYFGQHSVDEYVDELELVGWNNPWQK